MSQSGGSLDGGGGELSDSGHGVSGKNTRVTSSSGGEAAAFPGSCPTSAKLVSSRPTSATRLVPSLSQARKEGELPAAEAVVVAERGVVGQ